MRTLGIVLASVLLASCIRLAHLEKTPPTRTMEFTGSYEKVADCVLLRVGGKVHRYPSQPRIAVFDAANYLEPQGVSHYALIFFKTGDNSGMAEFRKRPEGPIQESMITRFWSPVEQCVKEVGGA